MGHSDLVMGYLDSSGNPVVQDWHGKKETPGTGHPLLDDSSDLRDTDLLDIGGGKTVLSFTRDLSNCDIDDLNVKSGTTRIIWATGVTPPTGDSPNFSYHTDRGSHSVYLFLPPSVGPPATGGDTKLTTIDLLVGKNNGGTEFTIPEYPAGGWAIEYYKPANASLGIEPFTMKHLSQGGIDTDNVHYKFMHDGPNSLDAKYDAIVGLGGGNLDECDWDEAEYCQSSAGPGTLYWWKTYNLTHITEKSHITRYEPILNEDNLKRTHHLLLYECEGPVDYDGIGYAPAAPPEVAQCNFAAPVAVWAVGGGSIDFPPEAGYPIGPGFGKYFLLEFHYDSPPGEVATHDDSGLRLYVTTDLRDNDIGCMYTGALLSDFIRIPAGKEAFKLDSYCTSDCTGDIPEDGLNVFSVLLHSHLAGREMRLQHMDYMGNEKPSPAYDTRYDFNLQEQQLIDTKFMPGDQLKLECTFDTSDRDFITTGGLGTYDEMCLAYMFYFPRMPLTACLSGAISPGSDDGVHYGLCITKDNDVILNKAIQAPFFKSFKDDLNPECPLEKIMIDDLKAQDDSLLGGGGRRRNGVEGLSLFVGGLAVLYGMV